MEFLEITEIPPPHLPMGRCECNVIFCDIVCVFRNQSFRQSNDVKFKRKDSIEYNRRFTTSRPRIEEREFSRQRYIVDFRMRG